MRVAFEVIAAEDAAGLSHVRANLVIDEDVSNNNRQHDAPHDEPAQEPDPHEPKEWTLRVNAANDWP